MSLPKLELFWGFFSDEAFSKGLCEANPYAVKTFINNKNPNYLHRITINGKTYLGKNIGSHSSIETLILLENNIYSIANKLVKSYNFEYNPAKLLVISCL